MISLVTAVRDAVGYGGLDPFAVVLPREGYACG
jgi:hypothetical protein